MSLSLSFSPSFLLSLSPLVVGIYFIKISSMRISFLVSVPLQHARVREMQGQDPEAMRLA